MKKIIKIIPTIVLLILILVSFSIGTKFINPLMIFSKVNPLSSLDKNILLNIRIPRTLICVLCGLLLGATGAVFQGFFRNPLADSGIMGVSSGATFGAVLSGFFSFEIAKVFSAVTLFAFAGAVFSSLCVYALSKFFRDSSGVSLLLSGTAVGTFFSAIASVILLTKQNYHLFYTWTMGSFNGKTWNDFLLFVFPSVLSLVLLMFTSRELDVLSSGEQSAVSLGLNLKLFKAYVLFSGSLAASCAVCAGGIISFVGLIAPHIVRTLYGPSHRNLIYQSMICGSILLLVSDTIARSVISPSELPVGIITSLIGVPFFIYILVKMQRSK